MSLADINGGFNMVNKQITRNPRANDRFVSWTDSDGTAWNVEFELKTVGSVARIHSFRISGTTTDARLTANHLREIPFGQLSEEFLRMAHQFLPQKKSETLPGSAGNRRATSLAELRRVASLYREASSLRVDTQKFVAAALNTSTPTAARRIRAARDIGLLEVKKPKTHKKGVIKK
jgi:hypothetical protein